MRGLGLDFKLLLALGINNPSVNKSFKSKLAEELQKKRCHTLFGCWYMFYSHSKQRFLEGIKCLKDNVIVDPFAVDLQVCRELTGVATHYV